MKKKAAIIFTAVFLIVTVIMHDGDLAVITSSFNASSISASRRAYVRGYGRGAFSLIRFKTAHGKHN